MSILLIRNVKRTFLNRNYYGSRDVFFCCLGVSKGQGNDTEKLGLISIISILSNPKMNCLFLALSSSKVQWGVVKLYKNMLYEGGYILNNFRFNFIIYPRK